MVKKKKSTTPRFKGAPYKRGMILRVAIQKPKKPNSAKRAIAKIRLSNGEQLIAYIPGFGHRLSKNDEVLVRGGGVPDLPGVLYHIVRNKKRHIEPELVERASRRSKFGLKRLVFVDDDDNNKDKTEKTKKLSLRTQHAMKKKADRKQKSLTLIPRLQFELQVIIKEEDESESESDKLKLKLKMKKKPKPISKYIILPTRNEIISDNNLINKRILLLQQQNFLSLYNKRKDPGKYVRRKRSYIKNKAKLRAKLKHRYFVISLSWNYFPVPRKKLRLVLTSRKLISRWINKERIKRLRWEAIIKLFKVRIKQRKQERLENKRQRFKRKFYENFTRFSNWFWLYILYKFVPDMLQHVFQELMDIVQMYLEQIFKYAVRLLLKYCGRLKDEENQDPDTVGNPELTVERDYDVINIWFDYMLDKIAEIKLTFGDVFLSAEDFEEACKEENMAKEIDDWLQSHPKDIKLEDFAKYWFSKYGLTFNASISELNITVDGQSYNIEGPLDMTIEERISNDRFYSEHALDEWMYQRDHPYEFPERSKIDFKSTLLENCFADISHKLYDADSGSSNQKSSKQQTTSSNQKSSKQQTTSSNQKSSKQQVPLENEPPFYDDKTILDYYKKKGLYKFTPSQVDADFYDDKTIMDYRVKKGLNKFTQKDSDSFIKEDITFGKDDIPFYDDKTIIDYRIEKGLNKFKIVENPLFIPDEIQPKDNKILYKDNEIEEYFERNGYKSSQARLKIKNRDLGMLTDKEAEIYYQIRNIKGPRTVYAKKLPLEINSDAEFQLMLQDIMKKYGIKAPKDAKVDINNQSDNNSIKKKSLLRKWSVKVLNKLERNYRREERELQKKTDKDNGIYKTDEEYEKEYNDYEKQYEDR